ncbi:GtrA family protein [Cognatilysobacter lacus]|uniref:GtrA family protein n=1 Tax=Cognatilysobacter lacus TaxID=1643323 RepID=UPI001659316A|nr:GtrA family protein [Lysobacter lacus]
MRISDQVALRLRFLLSGGTGFCLYYAFSLVLHATTTLGDGPCATLATLAAIPPTFALQKFFAFRAKGDAASQGVKYVALQIVSSVLIGSMSTLFQRVGLPSWISFLFAGVSGVALSYAVQSSLIFRRR